LLFRQWSGNITFFQHVLDDLDAGELEQLKARSICIVEGPVASLRITRDALSGVRMEAGHVVACEYLVVSPKAKTESPPLQSLGLQQAGRPGQGRHVAADPDGLTAVPGVWAAGNICDPTAQLVTAGGRTSLPSPTNHDAPGQPITCRGCPNCVRTPGEYSTEWGGPWTVIPAAETSSSSNAAGAA
jgi:hypothetical protein